MDYWVDCLKIYIPMNWTSFELKLRIAQFFSQKGSEQANKLVG
jgi:hypothetical protein